MDSTVEALIRKLMLHNQEGCITLTVSSIHLAYGWAGQNELKELLKMAKHKLLAKYPLDVSLALFNKLQVLSNQVDYDRYQQSLILFVCPDISEHTWIPIALESNVYVGDFFFTKELIRSIELFCRFYVLELSSVDAKFYMGVDQYSIVEVTPEIPLINRSVQVDRLDYNDLSFLYKVDKAIEKLFQKEHGYFYLVSDSFILDYFLRLTTNNRHIIGYKKYKEGMPKIEVAISRAWTLVSERTRAKGTNLALELIKKSKGSQMVRVLYDIYKHVLRGEGQTLLVEWSCFLPVLISDDELFLMDRPIETKNGVCSADIVNDLIAIHRSLGGRVVFFEKNIHPKLKNIVLIVK